MNCTEEPIGKINYVSDRIVGGREAKISEVPYQVAIMVRKHGTWCGGVGTPVALIILSPLDLQVSIILTVILFRQFTTNTLSCRQPIVFQTDLRPKTT